MDRCKGAIPYFKARSKRWSQLPHEKRLYRLHWPRVFAPTIQAERSARQQADKKDPVFHGPPAMLSPMKEPTFPGPPAMLSPVKEPTFLGPPAMPSPVKEPTFPGPLSPMKEPTLTGPLGHVKTPTFPGPPAMLSHVQQPALTGPPAMLSHVKKPALTTPRAMLRPVQMPALTEPPAMPSPVQKPALTEPSAMPSPVQYTALAEPSAVLRPVKEPVFSGSLMCHTKADRGHELMVKTVDVGPCDGLTLLPPTSPLLSHLANAVSVSPSPEDLDDALKERDDSSSTDWGSRATYIGMDKILRHGSRKAAQLFIARVSH